MSLYNIKYVSSTGDVIETDKDHVYLSSDDLRDYQYSYTAKNSSIVSFDVEENKEKQIVIAIYGDTKEEADIRKNRVYEIFDKDVITKKPGKLYIGDYYLEGYIFKSEKSIYLKTQKLLLLTLGFVTSYGKWVREELMQLKVSTSEKTYDYLDMPHDYDYDFGEPALKAINVDSFTDVNFKIIIYGICDNPKIMIGDNVYQVNCSIEYDEYLVIDSKEKKVLLHHANGETETKFNDRNRDYYIFEKIPNGIVPIDWYNCSDFDVIIYDERSEPRWT
jgi:hypothetical protein